MAGRCGQPVDALRAGPAHGGDPAPGPGTVTVGEAAAPERGAWARFAARLRDGRLEEVRFRAWGCPHVLSACELASARLEGRPDVCMAGLSAAALAQAVGAPPEKLGRLLVVEDALAALAAAVAASK